MTPAERRTDDQLVDRLTGPRVRSPGIIVDNSADHADWPDRAYWHSVIRSIRAAGLEIIDPAAAIENGAEALFRRDEKDTGAQWKTDSDRIDEMIREEYRECARTILHAITNGKAPR